MKLSSIDQSLTTPTIENKKSLADEFTEEEIANELSVPNKDIFIKEVTTRLTTKKEVPAYFQPLFQQEMIVVQLALENEKSSKDLGGMTFYLGKQVNEQNTLYISELFLNKTPQKRIGLDMEC